MNELQKDIFKTLELNFDELFFKRCEEFIKLLQQWGKVHSFTTELEDEQIINNMVDSLTPLKFINSFSSFADIGTGCGYPGLILALANPNIKASLVEPRAKRIAFLNYVKNSLDLNLVDVVPCRVENMKDDFKYDLITSRAVSNTNLLLDITKNITSNSSSYLFYKGSSLENELQNTNLKDYKVVNIENRNYLYIIKKD